MSKPDKKLFVLNNHLYKNYKNHESMIYKFHDCDIKYISLYSICYNKPIYDPVFTISKRDVMFWNSNSAKNFNTLQNLNDNYCYDPLELNEKVVTINNNNCFNIFTINKLSKNNELFSRTRGLINENDAIFSLNKFTTRLIRT